MKALQIPISRRLRSIPPTLHGLNALSPHTRTRETTAAAHPASMSDQHLEEQEMEAEALAAIFDTAFEIRISEQPFVWAVKLVPVDCGGDADEEEASNHIMVKLVAEIPLDYPEVTLPRLDLEIIKGLSKDNKDELLRLANDEAEANAGMPAIFAVCEAVRSWLADNNVKGLDDASMHAQMMRKAKDAERREVSFLRERLSLISRRDGSDAGFLRLANTIHSLLCNSRKHAKAIAWTRSLCWYRRTIFHTDKVWMIVEMLRRDNIWSNICFLPGESAIHHISSIQCF
jgi:hypothetical protein